MWFTTYVASITHKSSSVGYLFSTVQNDHIDNMIKKFTAITVQLNTHS